MGEEALRVAFQCDSAGLAAYQDWLVDCGRCAEAEVFGDSIAQDRGFSDGYGYGYGNGNGNGDGDGYGYGDGK